MGRTKPPTNHINNVSRTDVAVIDWKHLSFFLHIAEQINPYCMLAHNTHKSVLYEILVGGHILPSRDHDCRQNFDYERRNRNRNSSSEYRGRPTPSRSAKYNDENRCRFPYVFLGNPNNDLAFWFAGECQLLFPRTVLLGRSFYYCPNWSYADPKRSVHYSATTSLREIEDIDAALDCEWYFRGKLAVADAAEIRMPWVGIKLTNTHTKILRILETKYPHIQVRLFKHNESSSSYPASYSYTALPIRSHNQCTKKQGAKRCPNGCRKTAKQQCIPKHTQK
jgi:hypothetical protein